jgi:hypothetical protein
MAEHMAGQVVVALLALTTVVHALSLVVRAVRGLVSECRRKPGSKCVS